MDRAGCWSMSLLPLILLTSCNSHNAPAMTLKQNGESDRYECFSESIPLESNDGEVEGHSVRELLNYIAGEFPINFAWDHTRQPYESGMLNVRIPEGTQWEVVQLWGDDSRCDRVYLDGVVDVELRTADSCIVAEFLDVQVRFHDLNRTSEFPFTTVDGEVPAQDVQGDMHGAAKPSDSNEIEISMSYQLGSFSGALYWDGIDHHETPFGVGSSLRELASFHWGK